MACNSLCASSSSASSVCETGKPQQRSAVSHKRSQRRDLRRGRATDTSAIHWSYGQNWAMWQDCGGEEARTEIAETHMQIREALLKLEVYVPILLQSTFFRILAFGSAVPSVNTLILVGPLAQAIQKRLGLLVPRKV
eukprot:3540288-Rhodomonas_salina.1